MSRDEFQPGKPFDLNQRFPEQDQLIPAGRVREQCGDISDMTLWRWLANPEMNFPQPVYINTRRYWRRGDVTAWLETRR